MAEQGYGCVFGDCRSAVNHLITTISPPASVELCDEHYPAGLIPLLAAELGVDPGDFYANVERYLAREAKKAERALAEAQAAKAAEGSEGPAPDNTGSDPGSDDDQDEEDSLRAQGKREAESRS